MTDHVTEHEPVTEGNSVLFAFALAKFAIHLLTSSGYGYFRDEFYYLACSDRLALGYVDHPPLSIFLLAIQRFLLGDSLIALRFLPALAGGATVFVVGLMARRLGGGLFAQSLAMLATIVAPIYLGLNHFYSMNSFDLLFWAITAYVMIRIIQDPDPLYWLWLGLVLGLGLQNKISVLWLGFGLVVGFLLTRQRKHLLTPWPWISAVIAAVIFAPHILWQIEMGWPTLEFMRNATGLKMAFISPLEFLRAQILILNPINLPIWLAGLAFFFFHREGKKYRLLGWAWLAIFAFLAFSGSSRPGYLAPAYTWLLAGGAVAMERAFERAGELLGGALRATATGLVLAAGIVLAPLALPLLPVELYVAYAERLGIAPSTAERKEVAELPQFYADMHGWNEIVRTVAAVYQSLPPEDQSRVAIFCPNYGSAGAIDLLGYKYDLPLAISGHNNYWLWGPRDHTGDVVIYLGGEREDHEQTFEEVELGATIRCTYCMPYENNQPVWICRNLKRPIAEAWPGAKHFD